MKIGFTVSALTSCFWSRSLLLMNDNSQTTQVKKQTICRKRKLCIAIIFMNKKRGNIICCSPRIYYTFKNREGESEIPLTINRNCHTF